MPHAGESDLNSHAGQFFSTACSQRHALPYPWQYTADQWMRVIARMKQHMHISRMSSLNDGQTRQIEKFLEQNTVSSK